MPSRGESSFSHPHPHPIRHTPCRLSLSATVSHEDATISIPIHTPRKEQKANGNSVILGSFSNYLVTKSSVPVMVARKRLPKKSRRGPVAQVNNLSNPAGRSLASARID